MSLTEKDAFKLGFLTRCAEESLSGGALAQRIADAGQWAAQEKTAKNPLVTFSPLDLGPGALARGVGGLGETLTAGGLAILSAPFVAAPIAGAGLGYGAAKMIEPGISDEDVKAQELAATYKLYADKAKARRKGRKYRVEGNSEY
jgi:hypothetical protein